MLHKAAVRLEKPVKISKCNGTLLTEMDGQPSLDLLQKVYEELDENDQHLMQTSLFWVSRWIRLKITHNRGDFSDTQYHGG